MVVGLEFDFGSEEGNEGEVRDQFNSWTVLSKPGVTHLEVIIEESLKRIEQEANDHGVGFSDFTMEMVSDVVDVTGPKMMTLGLMKSLGVLLGERLDDRNISMGKLKEPVLLGDVLILPGGQLAAAQNGNPEDEGRELVTHHYAGSWKNDKGGDSD